MKIEKEFREKIKNLELERIEEEKNELKQVIYQEIAEYAYNHSEDYQKLSDMEYQSKVIMSELSDVIREINREEKLERYEKEILDSKLKCISSSYNDLIFENVTFSEISKRGLVDTSYFDRMSLKKIEGKDYLVRFYPKKMDYLMDVINIKRECKNVYDYAKRYTNAYIDNIKQICTKDITID